jgi:small subunit ribosomal protein S3
MGQKINPTGFRLETLDTNPQWQSAWYANARKYSLYLMEDKKIRDFIQKKFNSAGIVALNILRSTKKVKIVIVVARPGLVIGRGGKELEGLKKDLEKIAASSLGKTAIELQVEEFKHPDLSAKLVAEKIAYQLAKRMPYRRVVLAAMDKSMAEGAKGVKITLGGRINGAEISRREKFSLGQVPLSTIRTRIDYHETPSLTRSGFIGVKVYLCLG